MGAHSSATPSTAKGRHTRRWLVILSVLCAIGGTALLTFHVVQADSVDPGDSPSLFGLPASRSASPGRENGPTDAPQLSSAPLTLTLDRLGVTAPIVPATLSQGVLNPPESVSTVGIWTDGAPLNSNAGTTLLTGHVNLANQGNGAFADLHELRPGDSVTTTDEAGQMTIWEVTLVFSRPKSEGVDPTAVAGRDGPRRLALVTCGGDLVFSSDIGDYSDNVYLYAEVARPA